MDVESVKSLFYISSFTLPLSCTAICCAVRPKWPKRSAHFPCTTVTFSHDKITDKMNYKVIFCFLWWPQLMWLESLGLAGSLFRVGSVSDSLEILRPAATANTPRCDSSQTTQLVCTSELSVKKQTGDDIVFITLRVLSPCSLLICLLSKRKKKLLSSRRPRQDT